MAHLRSEQQAAREESLRLGAAAEKRAAIGEWLLAAGEKKERDSMPWAVGGEWYGGEWSASAVLPGQAAGAAWCDGRLDPIALPQGCRLRVEICSPERLPCCVSEAAEAVSWGSCTSLLIPLSDRSPSLCRFSSCPQRRRSASCRR